MDPRITEEKHAVELHNDTTCPYQNGATYNNSAGKWEVGGMLEVRGNCIWSLSIKINIII